MDATRRKPPTWSSAIPSDLDLADELETTATLGFSAVAVALTQVLAAKGIPVRERVAMVTQLTAQMPALISKRRLWEAEKLIKGEARELEAPGNGPKLEPTYAARTDSDQQARGPTPRRGRPRKRSLL